MVNYAQVFVYVSYASGVVEALLRARNLSEKVEGVLETLARRAPGGWNTQSLEGDVEVTISGVPSPPFPQTPGSRSMIVSSQPLAPDRVREYFSRMSNDGETPAFAEGVEGKKVRYR